MDQQYIIEQNFRNLLRVRAIISKWLIPLITSDPTKRDLYKKCTDHYLSEIERLLENQSPIWVANYFKEVRAITIKYISGNPVFVTKSFISIGRQGLPRVLGPNLRILAKSKCEIDLRFLLTLMKVTKILQVDPRPKVSSIIAGNPASGALFPQELLVKFFNTVQVGHVDDIRWTKYHMSTKSSPNGGRATYSAIKELATLYKKKCGPFENVVQAIGVIAGPQLIGYMDMLKNTKLVEQSEIVGLRRITAIQDKECKTRLICQLDYWSQTALLPLHNYFLKILAQLKQDCTFDQSLFLKDLPRRRFFACYDLKDATDRFPIELQQQVLNHLFGPDVATAWASLLTSLPYAPNQGSIYYWNHVNPNEFESGSPIHYASGQPMGAYSSWAIFALSHHLVIWWAAQRAGYGAFSDYSLLGDDLVIYCPRVAKEYQIIMSQLGVEISTVKSVVSTQLLEFASRHFLNGKEITGFSLVGLLNVQTASEMIEFLRTQSAKGYTFLSHFDPSMFRNLIKILSSNVSQKEKRPYQIMAREPANILELVYTLPMRELMTKTMTVYCHATSVLSCFPNKALEIFKGALLEEVAISLNRDIEKITTLHVTWAAQLSDESQSLFQDSSGAPLPYIPRIIPILGAWFDLKAETRDRLNQLTQIILDDDGNHDLSWVSGFPILYNIPDVNQAMRRRKAVRILTSNYSLYKRAYKRALDGKEFEWDTGL